MARQPRANRLFDTAPPSWLPRLSLSLDEGGPDRRAQGAEPAVSRSRPGGDRRRRHGAPAPRPRCLGGPVSDRRWRPPNPFVQGESSCPSFFRFKVGSTCLPAPLHYPASRPRFCFPQGQLSRRSEERSVGTEGVSTCSSRWSPY